MNNPGNHILDAYYQYLRADTLVKQRDGYWAVSLPFIVTSGHFVELHVRELMGGHLEISDGGKALEDLFLSGMSITGHRRRDIETILKEHSLQLRDGRVYGIASNGDTGQTVHRFVQALLQVGDLLMLHRMTAIRETKLAAVVRHEVLEKLPQNRYRWLEGLPALVRGKRITYPVDFLIQDRVALKTIERQRDLDTLLFAWAYACNDVKAGPRDTPIFTVTIYNANNPKWTDDLLSVGRESADRFLSIQEPTLITSAIQEFAA